MSNPNDDAPDVRSAEILNRYRENIRELHTALSRETKKMLRIVDDNTLLTGPEVSLALMYNAPNMATVGYYVKTKRLIPVRRGRSARYTAASVRACLRQRDARLLRIGYVPTKHDYDME